MSYGNSKNGLLRLPIDWTSDASGDVSEVLANYFGYQLLSVQASPGATAPSDLYDVVINDDEGEDIMAGELANQSDTTAETYYSDPPIPISGVLTVVVSNAGNAKTGKLLLIMTRQ